MQDVRLGIIGCGGMTGQHQPGFSELGEGVRIVGTADIDIDRACRAADTLGVSLAVADYRELFDHVDAVLLVVPHHLHRAIGIECLNAGKHLLIEKPLANSEAECLDLIRAAEANQKVLMVAYCVRYYPAVRKMKELLDRKVLGEVFQMSIWTEQYTRRDDPDTWHHTCAGLGGGQFFSHGCHYVDILLWFLGRPLRGYHLGTNHGTPWMEMEGTSNVTMEFEKGPLGYHFGTWGARGTRLGWSFHAHCTEGMLELANRGGAYRLTSIIRGREEEIFTQPSGKNTHHEIVHFVDCIRNGTKPLTDGPSSLQGLRVIWRLYEAERKGIVADLRGLGLDEPLACENDNGMESGR